MRPTYDHFLVLLVLHLAPENANFSFGLAPSTIRIKHHHSSPPVITCIDDVIVRIEMGLYSSRKLIILENAFEISKRFVKFYPEIEDSYNIQFGLVLVKEVGSHLHLSVGHFNGRGSLDKNEQLKPRSEILNFTLWFINNGYFAKVL